MSITYQYRSMGEQLHALGYAIGWSRQFKAPWKNVAALINVQKMDHIPVHLKPYVNGNFAAMESANFYRVR